MHVALPNFEIRPLGKISQTFLQHAAFDFHEATDFIAKLNYGRNANKEDLLSIFKDNRGTCSTKHAALKTLADENGPNEIKLMLGIFKMNAQNTGKVRGTLQKNGLDFIPEAHNYLKYHHQIFDFTRVNAKASDFEQDLLVEIEISPNQISDFKLAFHQEYLQRWLTENPKIKFTLQEIWNIRETCIRDLATI